MARENTSDVVGWPWSEGRSTATVIIEQGYEQERPGRIEVRLCGDEVRLFGAGVIVVEGVLHL